MNDNEWKGYRTNIGSWASKKTWDNIVDPYRDLLLNSNKKFGNTTSELLELLEASLRDTTGVMDDRTKIPRELRFPHDLDLTLPLIWGDEDNGEKVIEILETLEGRNVFNLNGKSEGHIYGISRKSVGREILVFYKNEINIGQHQIMSIEEFFGV
jgi:hypothetical protein